MTCNMKPSLHRTRLLALPATRLVTDGKVREIQGCSEVPEVVVLHLERNLVQWGLPG